MDLRASERGSALIGGVALSFVMLVLVATVLATWDHSNDATVRDRSRTQGLQSSEAGISTMIDALTRAICVPDIGMTSPESLVVDGRTVGQYQVIVRIPAEAGVVSPVQWDPNAISGPACTTTPPATLDRVITAWGYGPQAGSPRKVVRKVQVTVRVAPLGGFRFVCFAAGAAPNGVLQIQNNMTVNGDCYARTISDTWNNIIANGTLISPGDIVTKNNAVYQGSVWAGGSVTVGQNTTITQSVTSSSSSITLENNSQVLLNATAATSLTLDNNAVVHGTRCPASDGEPGCPTNPPPTLSMPTIRCADADVACWSSLYGGALNTSHTSATLTAWLDANRHDLAGQFYVSDTGTVTIDKDSTVTGPLTIITRGKLELSRTLSTPSSTTPPVSCTSPAPAPSTCEVIFVSLNTASDAIRVRAPRFTANMNTISLLLYSRGTVLLDAGATPTTYRGSVYAANLDLRSNGFTVSTSQDLIDYPPPFIDWTLTSAAQFSVLPVEWREMRPEVPV